MEESLVVSGVRVELSNPKHVLEWTAEGEKAEGSSSLHPGGSVKKTFHFLPDPEDVGSRLRVKGVAVILGRTDGFRLALRRSLGAADGSAEQQSSGRGGFIIPRLKATTTSSDEADGDAMKEVSLLDNVDGGEERPSAEVLQREPLMTMRLEHPSPALVGEWFPVDVVLENLEKEAGSVQDVEVTASLADAYDPLVADTTTLTFDPDKVAGSSAPAAATGASTPATPSAEDGARQAWTTARTDLGSLSKDEERRCRLHVRCSTTGRRGIRVQVSYSITTPSAASSVRCRSSLSEFLGLQTLEPFSMESSLLSCRLRPIQQAHTDEPFLLAPGLRCLTPHSLRVLDSWLEARAPLRPERQPPPPSQLKGCLLGKASEAKEIFPVEVRRKDLLTSLDVQVLHGDFVFRRLALKYFLVRKSPQANTWSSGAVPPTTPPLPPPRRRRPPPPPPPSSFPPSASASPG